MLLAAIYMAAVVAVGLLVRPLNRWALSATVLLPAAIVFLFSIPMVVRSRPRGLMALFHLVLYPIAAAITLGLPGALVAYLIADQFGG